MSPMDKIIDILAGITLVIIVSSSLIRGYIHNKKNQENIEDTEDKDTTNEGKEELEEHSSTGSSIM